MAEPQQNTSAARRIDVQEFCGNLTSFLQQVHDGQQFVLTSHHKAVAEIGPPSYAIVVRKPDALCSKIKLAIDFDTLSADARKAALETSARYPALL